MKNKIPRLIIGVFLSISLLNVNAIAQTNSLGIFDDQSDIGPVKHKGSGTYDNASQQYHLEGWYKHLGHTR